MGIQALLHLNYTGRDSEAEHHLKLGVQGDPFLLPNTDFPSIPVAFPPSPAHRFLPGNRADTHVQRWRQDGTVRTRRRNHFNSAAVALLMPPSSHPVRPTAGGGGRGSAGDHREGARGCTRARASQGFSHVPAVTPDGGAGTSGSPRSSCWGAGGILRAGRWLPPVRMR